MQDSMDLPRVFPWALRAAWVALPFSAGAAFGAALHPHSEPVRLTAAVLLWAGWAVVLVGTLAPWPVGLTTLRVVAPVAAVAAVAAAVTNRPSTLASLVAVVTTLGAVVLAITPAAGQLYVNGSAYPNERRFPLAVPGPLLLGPLEVAWAVTVGAPTAGLLLLAARAWVPGAIVLVVGGPAAAVLARSLHGLSRRWVVFVPAGLVLHDPLTLADPVLFERRAIAMLRPAPRDSEALDLSQGGLGLTLELILVEEAQMVLRRRGEMASTDRLLVTPARPGLVMQEAKSRRLPVG
jgi:hypothetical protein